MFSGIVEAIGTLIAINEDQGCQVMTIATTLNDLQVGDSIAVNGVCLTVTSFTQTYFTVTAVPETLRLTNLNDLNVKDQVNLERSLTLNRRIGGHLVQGHIDGMGVIFKIVPDHSQALLVHIQLDPSLRKYIVRKGYIAIDGMSMTIVAVGPTWFVVTIIPHTQQATLAQYYRVNSKVNIETDILGKYIEKLMHTTPIEEEQLS